MFTLAFAVIGLSVFFYLSGMKTTLLFLSVFLSANLFGQNVYIPDANFKTYLVGNPDINTNGDTEIQLSEAGAFSGGISCINCNIADLTGIEAFTSFTSLSIIINQVTSLDLSQNSALMELYCEGNPLTSLDLSQNIELIHLNCMSTALTCLNVANGNNTNISASTTFQYNSNLSCIQVDDAAWSTANWTNIDPQVSFSEDCNNDCSTTSNITELNTTSKNLIKILDMMGCETTFKPNTPLIYVYDDGSIEKVFRVEY